MTTVSPHSLQLQRKQNQAALTNHKIRTHRTQHLQQRKKMYYDDSLSPASGSQATIAYWIHGMFPPKRQYPRMERVDEGRERLTKASQNFYKMIVKQRKLRQTKVEAKFFSSSSTRTKPVTPPKRFIRKQGRIFSGNTYPFPSTFWQKIRISAFWTKDFAKHSKRVSRGSKHLGESTRRFIGNQTIECAVHYAPFSA